MYRIESCQFQQSIVSICRNQKSFKLISRGSLLMAISINLAKKDHKLAWHTSNQVDNIVAYIGRLKFRRVSFFLRNRISQATTFTGRSGILAIDGEL